MEYLKLSIIDKNILRQILRRWGIKYKQKQTKIKLSNGNSRLIKVSYITEEHIKMCIEKINASSHKRKNGTCKLIQDKETIKILKRIKNA